MVTAVSGSSDSAADIATGITDGGGTATAAVFTTTADTTLSFSGVAFSVPIAMHLSRYGRLPS